MHWHKHASQWLLDILDPPSYGQSSWRANPFSVGSKVALRRVPFVEGKVTSEISSLWFAFGNCTWYCKPFLLHGVKPLQYWCKNPGISHGKIGVYVKITWDNWSTQIMEAFSNLLLKHFMPISIIACIPLDWDFSASYHGQWCFWEQKLFLFFLHIFLPRVYDLDWHILEL